MQKIRLKRIVSTWSGMSHDICIIVSMRTWLFRVCIGFNFTSWIFAKKLSKGLKNLQRVKVYFVPTFHFHSFSFASVLWRPLVGKAILIITRKPQECAPSAHGAQSARSKSVVANMETFCRILPQWSCRHLFAFSLDFYSDLNSPQCWHK